MIYLVYFCKDLSLLGGQWVNKAHKSLMINVWEQVNCYRKRCNVNFMMREADEMSYKKIVLLQALDTTSQIVS